MLQTRRWVYKLVVAGTLFFVSSFSSTHPRTLSLNFILVKAALSIPVEQISSQNCAGDWRQGGLCMHNTASRGDTPRR